MMFFECSTFTAAIRKLTLLFDCDKTYALVPSFITYFKILNFSVVKYVNLATLLTFRKSFDRESKFYT